MNKVVIGIDLGGTSIKYALLGEAGKLIYKGARPSYASVSREMVIESLCLCVEDIKRFISKDERFSVSAIGIGTPGIIDETNRIVIGGADNIKGWENVPLAQIVEQQTSFPTIVVNDANAMGLGEKMFGAGKGFSHIVFVTVGTGIGGAVIIDGKLFNGYSNRGTEFGHVPFIANGRPCTCGSVGCLEAYASTSALVRSFVEANLELGIKVPEDHLDGKYIVERYRLGDPIAIKCLNQHCDYLGHGIAGFINVFSPQLVVVGGGLSEAGAFYIENVRKAAFRYAMKDCASNTKVVAAKLGNMAGTLGAASLAFSL